MTNDEALKLVNDRINALGIELQDLVARRDSMSKDLRDIEIRLTQIAGALQELTIVSETFQQIKQTPPPTDS